MGIILSRVRKKKSAVETLEKLESDIKELEENRANAQLKHKRITKLFLVWSFILYVLCGVVFYFHFTSSLKGKLLYLVPLALSPLLLYLFKRIISWYYVRLINKNQLQLKEMKNEKKKILDEVMDKETYKVAKEILEKFSTESAPKPKPFMALASFKQPDEGIRKRLVPAQSASKPQLSSNMVKDAYLGFKQPSPSPSTNLMANRVMQGRPNMVLPAPILPLQRSYVDRVVEYLIGDGPNNRYALICSQCHSHNGMALKEEFEYIGFKCCYCGFFNPARKIRPEAPKLENTFRENHVSDSDSDSKGSENNSDEKPPDILESNNKLEETSMDSEEIAETTSDLNLNEDVSSVSLNDKEDSDEKASVEKLISSNQNDIILEESKGIGDVPSPKT